MSASSSSEAHDQLQLHEEDQHAPSTPTATVETATTAASSPTYVAFVFVPRYAPENQNEVGTVVTPRPLPGDCRDEERAFLNEFVQEVKDLARACRRRFPYKQTIRWSIEYGDGKTHTVNVIVKPPRSTP